MENKKQKCIKLLATEFISYKENSKVNIASFYNNYPFSKGTVYSALNFLIENKAIVMINKTNQGSYIQQLSYHKLFKYSGNKKIICVSPIPFTSNLKIISSALEYVFKNHALPFEIIYKPGGLKRAELINENSMQMALVSKIAANKLVNKYSNISLIRELGSESWTNSHAIIFSKSQFKKITPGMRIGIDNNSPDISILTKALVKNTKVEFINKKYYTLLEEIQNKSIDAVIYNHDDIVKDVGYVVPATSLMDNKQLLYDSTIATIIINNKNIVLKNIFKNLITTDKLLRAIGKVKKDKSLINY